MNLHHYFFKISLTFENIFSTISNHSIPFHAVPVSRHLWAWPPKKAISRIRLYNKRISQQRVNCPDFPQASHFRLMQHSPIHKRKKLVEKIPIFYGRLWKHKFLFTLGMKIRIGQNPFVIQMHHKVNARESFLFVTKNKKGVVCEWRKGSGNLQLFPSRIARCCGAPRRLP